MNGLDTQTVIAILSLLTGLGFLFNMLLYPVKKDIARLEAGQARFDKELKEIKDKLDQLLAKS